MAEAGEEGEIDAAMTAVRRGAVVAAVAVVVETADATAIDAETNARVRDRVLRAVSA